MVFEGREGNPLWYIRRKLPSEDSGARPRAFERQPLAGSKRRRFVPGFHPRVLTAPVRAGVILISAGCRAWERANTILY